MNRIREVEKARGRTVPIVGLTTKARVQVLPDGVEKVVTKPLQPEELERVVNQVRRRIDANSNQDPETWDRRPEEIRAAFPMSGEAMNQVVFLFRESCVERISRIHQALEIRSASEIVRNSHALKGSLGIFASTKTLQVVAELEHEVKLGNYEGAREHLETLELAIDHLQPTLDRLTSDLES